MPGMFDVARRSQTASREFLIEILASNQASPELRKVASDMLFMGNASLKAFGQFMVWRQVGQNMARVGDSILRAAGAVGKMALDFDYNMRIIRTQTNLTNKQFDDFKNKALEITKTVPQSAQDVSTALYDIFSSTDVNYKQALFMVTNFAKAATAGATDISVAEKAIIAEMNAYQLPVKDTTRLLDLQFQMVRYGVGTYQDFATAIGNMLPAGRNMNQTLETLSGAAAFMSRNGFTAAQSTISVARAMDQLVRHRTDIKDTLGVDIVDKATGKYKQLGDIMSEFALKMGGMTGPQREAALKDMFGAGEIRANRFFRVAIPNIGALSKMIDHMKDSKGALGVAFGDVKESPLVKFRIEINRIKADLIGLATAFLPYVGKFLGFFTKMLDWLDKLSPALKNAVVIGLLLSGVFLSVGGRLVMVMAGFKGVVSMMGLTGQSFTALMGPVGIALAAMVAVALAAYLIYKNWNKITAWWKRNWDTIKQVVGAAVAFIAPLLAVKLAMGLLSAGKAFMSLVTMARVALSEIGDAFKLFLASNWIALVIGLVVLAAYLIITHWGQVKRFLLKVWDDIKKVAITVWGALVHFFMHTIAGTIIRAIIVPWTFVIQWLIEHWQFVVNTARKIWSVLTVIFNAVIVPLIHLFQEVWSFIVANAKIAFQILYTIFYTSLKAIGVAWKIAWDIVSLEWKILWQAIKIAWYAIGYPIFLIIKTIIELWVKYIIWLWKHVWTPAWNLLWKGVKWEWENIGKPIFHAVGDVLKWVWNNLLSPTIKNTKRAWDDLWSAAKWVWEHVGKPVTHAIGTAFSTLRKALGIAWDGIATAWSTFWGGLERTAATVMNSILGAVQSFINFFIGALNWVRTKFGLSKIPPVNLGRVHWGQESQGVGGGPAGQKHLAKGTRNWSGGYAWVGEEGPEVVFVPKGARVWPADESKQMFGRPLQGFAGGLGGDVGAIVSVPGKLFDFIGKAVGMGISKGTGYLVDAALKLFHVHTPLIKNMVMTGAELFKSLKDSFFTWAKGLLSKVQLPGGGNSYGGAGSYVGGWNGAGSPAANYYRGAVQAAWPGLRFGGIYNRRFIKGTSTWSQHAYGNAVDEMTPSLAYGDMVHSWVASRAGQFHLAHLLWRVPDHFNHIHADFWPQGVGNPRAGGGWVNEPVFGIGRSGRTYSFGERESEYVTPASKMRGGGGHTFIFNGIHQHDTGEIVRAINWELATDGR